MDVVRPVDDVMAAALRAPDASLWVESADGETFPTDISYWRDDPGAVTPTDVGALDLVEAGSVLDVGCATGRYLSLLRDAGFVDLTGVDRCAEAVARTRGRGHRCYEMDVWALDVLDETFDNTLLLGGNLGLAETAQRLPDFLRIIARVTRPGGQIIASMGPSGPGANSDTLRLVTDDHVSEWFTWLTLDADRVERVAAQCGLEPLARRKFGPLVVLRLRRPT